MMILTEDQERSKYEILQTINSTHLTDDNRFHTLRGCAGSGKSTLIANILKEISVHKTIGVTAPTHKACKVLENMILENGMRDRVDVRTIHSALGLKMLHQGEREVLVKDTRSNERVYDILLIDECSMLDDDLISYVLESLSKVVVFIGDDCQISPVNSPEGEISKVFTEVSKQSKLTEVVRCAFDNPIINLATQLRLAQKDLYPTLPDIAQNLDNGNGIHVLEPNEFVDKLFDCINSEDFNNDVDHVRCIAYTNDCVNKINNYIRIKKYGSDVDEYVVGETLVSQESKGDMFTQIYKNAEELEIVQIDHDVCFEHTDEGIPCFLLKLKKLSDSEFCDVKVVKKDGVNKLNHLLQTYADRAKADKNTAGLNWNKFWEIKKDFGTFKHIYCMTAHKSQGSTFRNTFVYLPDFLQYGVTVELLQLLYTATTRSSLNTYFTK